MSDIIQVNPLVFGGEGESVHANILTKLWENPAPTSDFVAGDVTLSSSDYDFTLWQVKYARNVEVYQYYICEKGKRNIFFFSSTSTGSYTATTRRDIDSASETTYTLGNCYLQNSNSTRSADNAYLIPIAVYGFKKSLDITSIVSNVSTDASRCILDDGVTSVQDSLDGSTDTTSVANVTFSRSGNVVTVNLNGFITTSNTPQFTVPSQFRPSNSYLLDIVYNYTDKAACFFDIGSGGAVRVRSLANADVSGKTIYGTVTYVI